GCNRRRERDEESRGSDNSALPGAAETFGAINSNGPRRRGALLRISEYSTGAWVSVSSCGFAAIHSPRFATFFLFQCDRGRNRFQSDRELARSQRWRRPGGENVWAFAERALRSDGAKNDVRCRRGAREHDCVCSTAWVRDQEPIASGL